MPPASLSIPDDLRPWDRQPGETLAQFHAFCHFRDIPTGRSVDKAYRRHKTDCDKAHIDSRKRAIAGWHLWHQALGWAERAAMWDREIDRQAQEKIAKDQRDARSRHAKLAQGAMTALSVPVRAVMEVLHSPAALQQIVDQAKTNPKALIKLVDLVSWASKSIPGLVTVERLSLGLTTEAVEIDDKRDVTVGMDIPNDPASTDLALALLNRLAGARQGAAGGASDAGAAGADRGAVVSGAAPGSPDPSAD